MDSIGSSLLMFALVLALVPVAIWALRRLRGLGPSRGERALAIVDQIALGPRERVLVLRAGERLLVLGATAQQVNLLCELKPGELGTAAPAAPGPVPEAPSYDFFRRLQDFSRQPALGAGRAPRRPPEGGTP